MTSKSPAALFLTFTYGVFGEAVSFWTKLIACDWRLDNKTGDGAGALWVMGLSPFSSYRYE